MLSVPSLTRSACFVAGCALALLLASAARSQSINVSLNVHYSIPSDVNSGGTWEIFAKSTNHGIAGLNLRLTSINPAVVNQAPRGKVNVTDNAGFTLDVFPNVNYRTVSLNQFPVFPTGMEEEAAFYGVGTLLNGEPGDIGPTFTSLTNTQDIPWATGDTLPDPLNEWTNAAMFASGTFGVNVTPGFFSGSGGSVFTTIGTSTSFGNVGAATLTTTVRTNFEPASELPDYNGNGVVDAADYAVWGKGHPLADGNGDTMVDALDYELWAENFDEMTGTGAGAGAGNSGAAVPEPGCAALVFGLFAAIVASRRSRTIG
jgi:hypothetical protein